MTSTTDTKDATTRILAIGYEKHPSMRLRVQQYEGDLLADGFALKTFLLPQAGQSRPQDHGRRLWKAIGEADVVVVQRVLLGWLNLLLRVARKPVVFDLDDAVHYIRPSQLEATEHPVSFRDRSRVRYRTWMRGSPYHSSRKRLLEQLLSFSDGVILGNPTLFEELAPVSRGPIAVIPTSVPAHPDEIKEHDAREPVRLGWVGVRGSLIHLETLEPAFHSLPEELRNRTELHVVTSQEYQSAFLPTKFTPWSVESEKDLVRTFDVGLMPLVDDPYSRGKCAFKAVLCMSYGIPVVISPVGLNAELVRDGWNGYLASEADDWAKAITTLVEDCDMRKRLGRNAFTTIEEGYSTKHAYPLIRSMLERVAHVERGTAL